MTRWDYFVNSLFVAAMFAATLSGLAGLVVMADYLDENTIKVLELE